MNAADTQLAPSASAPLAMIRDALATGVSPDHLRELLAVRREWEADEARKAYNVAVSIFQARCPIVAKADTAHNKKYAAMDRIWREIRPLVTELGLSVTWQVCEAREGGICHLEGQLRHRDGHGERLIYDIPIPEIVPGQNRAQQMGSASTYARRYATTAALGIVTGLDDDDDGNKAGTAFLTVEQAREVADLVDTARGINGFNEAAFWQWANAAAASEIASNRYGDVCRSLRAKIAGKPTKTATIVTP